MVPWILCIVYLLIALTLVISKKIRQQNITRKLKTVLLVYAVIALAAVARERQLDMQK